MRLENVIIENAKILGGPFKNFSGEQRGLSPAGKRTFCVALDKELADQLQKEGWNVKITKPRDDEEEGTPFLQVTVKYSNYPPKIYRCTRKNKVLLTEDQVSDLDHDEFEKVDLEITPYEWALSDGKSGVTAYLKLMYVTIVEDVFAHKYDDMEEEEEVPWK